MQWSELLPLFPLHQLAMRQPVEESVLSRGMRPPPCLSGKDEWSSSRRHLRGASSFFLAQMRSRFSFDGAPLPSSPCLIHRPQRRSTVAARSRASRSGKRPLPFSPSPSHRASQGVESRSVEMRPPLCPSLPLPSLNRSTVAARDRVSLGGCALLSAPPCQSHRVKQEKYGSYKVLLHSSLNGDSSSLPRSLQSALPQKSHVTRWIGEEYGTSEVLPSALHLLHSLQLPQHRPRLMFASALSPCVLDARSSSLPSMHHLPSPLASAREARLSACLVSVVSVSHLFHYCLFVSVFTGDFSRTGLASGSCVETHGGTHSMDTDN